MQGGPDLHSLLRRQLVRLVGTLDEVPASWRELIDVVNAAYLEFDDDRNMLERSLDLSSMELMQANAEMRAVFEVFPDLFLWLDPEGTIVHARAGDPDDLLVPPEGLVGRRLQDVPDPEAQVLFAAALRELREGRHPDPVSYQLRHSPADAARHYEARLVKLVDQQVLAIVRNTSALRRAEEERLRASKIDSLALLAGGIAHDFNNFLSVVLSNLSLAQHPGDDPAEQALVLQEATLATRRARNLTQQLLTFARGGEPIRGPLSVRQLLQETVPFALRGSNVRPLLTLPEDLPNVNADSGQLGQVISNLVINADEAMPSGGALEVTASVVQAELPAHLPLGPYVRIVFKDEGTGIQPKQLSSIFDPYYSTKQRGSGLGLATAWSIVQQHEGALTVESDPGHGTTFRLWLPVCIAAARPAHPPQPISGEGHVLVMDDEVLILRATSLMLRRLGYSCETAENGEEALRLMTLAASGDAPSFDAMILDLTVPGGMGGLEALKALKALQPSVLAIATSGYSSDPVLSRFEEYGFAGRLPKPYDLGDLGETLAQVLPAADYAAKPSA